MIYTTKPINARLPRHRLNYQNGHHFRSHQNLEKIYRVVPISAMPQFNMNFPSPPTSKPKKQKTNILTKLLSISSAPYSSYVPEPSTFLHDISAEVKQIWTIGILLLMSRASTTMRLVIAATIALISISGLPPRLWKPQLLRIGGLCAIIFCLTAFGSDGAPPVLSDRSPPLSLSTPPPPSLSAIDTQHIMPLSTSMNEIISNKYRYVLIHLGPFSVTRRSLSLAITFTGLTFTALQTASLCLVTTPPERMALALGRCLAPFKYIGVPVKELVLTVLLSLRFMATVFEEGRNLCLGLASRGIDWSLLGGQGTLALALRTCSRLFSNLLARCENIAVSMAARGFRGPEDHVLYVAARREGKVWSEYVANGTALAVLAVLFLASKRVV